MLMLNHKTSPLRDILELHPGEGGEESQQLMWDLKDKLA